MTSYKERIEICKQSRQRTSEQMAEIFAERGVEISEKDFSDRVIKSMAQDSAIWPTGWYDPPPGGTVMFFSSDSDFSRLQYDSPRKEQFWPRADHKLGPQGCAGIYYSPVHRATGIIGDFGMTVYLGSNARVRAHVEQCLSVLRKAAAYIEVGMEFREIHNYAQGLFQQQHFTNGRTLAMTDTAGTNLGHTVPWSYEDPTKAEEEIISGPNFLRLKDLISQKRVHLNRLERFTVPKTIAFTLEARLEAVGQPDLPNTFFHFIVAFIDGKKEILENFEPVFKALGQEPL
jgi:hypothetical protein